MDINAINVNAVVITLLLVVVLGMHVQLRVLSRKIEDLEENINTLREELPKGKT